MKVSTYNFQYIEKDQTLKVLIPIKYIFSRDKLKTTLFGVDVVAEGR